jgi:DNA polymerase-3 subunit gamma/tau
VPPEAPPTPPEALLVADEVAAMAGAEGHEPEVAAAVDRSPEAAAAANADFLVLEQAEGLWEEIKRDVRPKSPMVQALLHGVRPIDVEGQVIVLLASSSFHKENLEKAQNRRIVEDVISKHLGKTYTIRCTIEAKTEARDLRGQIREARKDELVRAAMNIFEAHIVDIEPES